MNLIHIYASMYATPLQYWTVSAAIVIASCLPALIVHAMTARTA